MLLTQTGLDITLDEQTGELSFGSGVLCDGHSEKRLAAMEGLFESIEGEDGDQRVYWAYRNIRRPEDDAAWAEEILAVRRRETDRTRGADTVRLAGYDIRTEARKLLERYIRMAERAYPPARP